MHKKVIFLLMIAFCLQMNWSSAKAYCMHESGNAAQHIGHHQHQHASTNSDDGGAKTTSVQLHADCVSCVSILSVVPVLESTAIPALSVTHQVHPLLLKIPKPFLARPERPQWF